MKKIYVAKQLVRIARALVGLKFKTKKEMQNYKKQHNVRKDTKLQLDRDRDENKDKKPSSIDKGEIKKQILTKIRKMNNQKKIKMIKNKDIPDFVANYLSNNSNQGVKNELAKKQGISKDVLQKLSTDNSDRVRLSVAGNTSTDIDTLDKMGNDENDNVRNKATKNYSVQMFPEGKENAKIFIKKPIQKKAVQATEDGVIETREGNATYKKGDFIAQDGKGGKYPIKQEDFSKLYTPTNDPTIWMSKPKEVKMFKTNKQMDISTQWGTYKASVGDFVEITKDGKYGAPRKPDVIIDDYNYGKNDSGSHRFKSDDKTQAIIRNRFEKNSDEQETNTIYNEMADFHKNKVAPWGTYHGRSKDQIKADFIKNMNPANYSSPQSFKNAQNRIKKLSANDFSKMLASIFKDEED